MSVKHHQKKQPSQMGCSPLAMVLFVLLLLVIAAIGAWFWVMVPRLAADTFGLPVSYLTPLQRFSYSAQLLLSQQDLLVPKEITDEQIPVVIESGESVNSIALKLEQAGVVRDAPSFRLYLIYAGLDTSIQAGSYQLSPGLSAVEIAGLIQDATSREVRFVILPGWRAEEVAAALAGYGLDIKFEQFMAVVHAPQQLSIPDAYKSLSSLEGFLFPGEYRISRSATENEVVAMFVYGFDSALTPQLRAGFQQQGLNVLEGVILASMVQREAMLIEEMPTIASVFLNRRAVGMKYDSDPTVQYAIGTASSGNPWWKSPLSYDDLTVDSPYNTYLYGGLPPGPICNPGLEALQAVALPAQTPYYYFRGACDGSLRHEFARTYEEQLENACP